jgi:hypothetical protein
MLILRVLDSARSPSIGAGTDRTEGMPGPRRNSTDPGIECLRAAGRQQCVRFPLCNAWKPNAFASRRFIQVRYRDLLPIAEVRE